MRSAGLQSKYDNLIRQLCNDPRYEVRRDGTIWTNRPPKGHASVIVPWREIGRSDREGYREVKYKYVYLRMHRILFQKFNGELEQDMVIDHINGNQADNRPENLRKVSHKTNCFYRDRRRERTV